MASENEDENRKTVADIVKELRRQSDSESKLATQLRKTDDDVDFALASCYDEDAKYLSQIADCLEAAAKREKADAESDALAVGGIVEAARTTEKTSAVGNAAATREALAPWISLGEWLIQNAGKDALGQGVAEMVPKLRERIDESRAALSAPARNCDRFKTREEARQYFDDVVCLRSNGCGSMDCKGCSYDSIDNPHRADCREQWLLAPAAERKGEDEK